MDPDFRLIAIPPAHVLLADDAADQCRAAAQGGATSIQVRLKNHPARDIIRIVDAIRQVVGVPVYVNDRVDVAAAALASGVHLGADDLPASAIDRVVPAGIRIGLSVGTPMEAQRAKAVRRAHYWSLGPFGSTAQKADAGSPLGADGFQRLAALAPRAMPVIAIGGITPDLAVLARAAGAQGVAVISAIFDAKDIQRATRRLRDAVDS
jgi:thiamine-phosphate pyrophosphorylase